MTEVDASLVAQVVYVLPRKTTFPCGHPLDFGNVRIINGRFRCRRCLNASTARCYEKRRKAHEVGE